MLRETKREFIPKERGSLPRVLLLDFDKSAADKISKESNLQVFEGKTGMVDGERLFPRDSSEIEIIFLDTAKWDSKYSVKGGNPFEPTYEVRPTKISSLDTLQVSLKTTEEFFTQVMRKGGAIVIFLGDAEPLGVLKDELLCLSEANLDGLSFSKRYATSLSLEPLFTRDMFYNFFQRFVNDKDIKYCVNLRLARAPAQRLRYFIDEDDNYHAAVMNGRFIISPKARDLEGAVLFLLQDVFPFVCEEKIYPDLQRFKWLEDKLYTFPEITKQEKRIEALIQEYDAAVAKERESLIGLKKKHLYLQELLYKDDSNSFEEGERLKDIVKRVLEEDLGFKDVRDMDKERLAQGLALKEDLVSEGYIFIEVKGTERGASPGWVDQLARHVKQYCVATETDIGEIKEIVIFNHERRRDPQERSEPFKSDPTFLASCERDKVALVPVFELFKLIMGIKEEKITQEDARTKIVTCGGLFKS